MPQYRKYIYSGDVLEVEEYFSPRKAGKTLPRGRNKNLTREQQAEWNLIRARKNLARLINTNFGEGDLFISLTHRKAVSEEKGKKELSKFFRRVREYRKRHKLPELKYIGVTECGELGREHHHVVMSAHDIEHISKLWKLGRVITSKLEPGGDYTGLANYITKETAERYKNRWCASRNLEKPRVVRREVMRKAAESRRNSLKAPKGYTVVMFNRYFSYETGEMLYLKAIRNGGYDYAFGDDCERCQGQKE